jgi:hypothetical protein
MTESSSQTAPSPSTAPVDLPTELISRYREDCAMRGMSPESLR